MNSFPSKTPSPDSVEQTAAYWVMRRDRGLTASEQDELSQWLAADARHGAALALLRWGWDELDRLTGLQTSLSAVADPDLLAPRASSQREGASRRWWLMSAPIAAAAAIAIGLYVFRYAARPPSIATKPAISTALATPCERRVLEDGSVVDLNRGAAVAVDYTSAARGVHMQTGEASFTVAKNAGRPFIVYAGDFEVRAVGTAFNVRLSPGGVEVLVTEGKVEVGRAGAHAEPTEVAPLGAGQFALLHSTTAPPRVAQLTSAQMDAHLAWQPRLLDFTDAPLATIVARFNAHNPVQLSVEDASLAALPLSATFRSDNVEGFVTLMESAFGMRAEWRSEREIALVRAP